MINKKSTLFVFGFTLLLRLVVSIYFYNIEIWNTFADDNSKSKYADRIIENGYVFEVSNYEITSKETLFAPFIPSLIALNKLVFGDNWLSLFLVNALIGAVLCIIIYLISSTFFNHKISILAMIWAAIYPNYIRYIGSAGSEPWIVFFFALTFLFAIKCIELKKIRYILIIGYALSLALLFHTDERYLIYSFLFTMVLFVGSHPIMFKLKKAVLFGFFVIFFSTPWLIINYIVYDDIVVISCRTTNLTKHFIDHREELLFYDHTPNRSYLSPSQIDSVRNGNLTTFTNGKQIYPVQIEAMKKGNIPHSFTLSEKIFSRMYFLWVPFKFHDNYRITGYAFNPAWSLKHNLMTGISYGLLLPFVFIAFVILLRKRKWKEVILFGGVMFYQSFIHIAFIPYTRDRYRHPIDFAVIILGIYGMLIAFNFIKTKYYRKKIPFKKMEEISAKT